MTLQESVDVLVVGGGPIGLQLAGELRLGGATVLVVERLAAASTTIRAGSVGPQSAELFDRRGTLEPLQAWAADLFAKMQPAAPATTPSDSTQPSVTTPAHAPSAPAQTPATQATPPSGSATAPQGPATAPATAATPPSGPTAAPASPAAPHGGAGTMGPAGFTPPAAGHFAGLWVLRGDPAGTSPALVAPQQVVEVVLEAWARELGADVRRGCTVTGLTERDGSVEVALEDGTTLTAAYVVGCDGGRSFVRKAAGFDFPGTGPTITGRQALVEIANPEVLERGWNRTSEGMVVFGPGANRVLTVEFDGPPADREAPVTAGELEASLRRVSGRDVRVTGLISGTRWTDNTRQASTYRMGRILLAGDAAHIHPPFGGQGLNLGLQDAANLGWKLAAVVTGRAPATLLDTYTAERHPVAARALANTRAQVALMRPDPQSGALRELFADLMAYDEPNAHVSRIMTSGDAVYDVGCTHPAAGRLVVDREVLVDDRPVRLFEHLRSGRVTVVTPTKDLDTPVDVVLAEDGPSMLVRPDGIVAWAGDDAQGLAEAITRWG